MSTTYVYTGTLTIIECYSCHVDFGLPTGFYRDRRDDHADFWCPSGHRQHFPAKSDIEIEREKTERAERLASRRLADLDQVRAERDHLGNVVRAEKGAKTKLKKRIAAGICPCCKRSFVDLGRHMAGQHPEYAE